MVIACMARRFQGLSIPQEGSVAAVIKEHDAQLSAPENQLAKVTRRKSGPFLQMLQSVQQSILHIKNMSNPLHQFASKHQQMLYGEYKVIMNLVRTLNHGTESKHFVDEIINHNDHIIHIR